MPILLTYRYLYVDIKAIWLPKLKIAHAIGKAVWDQVGDIADVCLLHRLQAYPSIGSAGSLSLVMYFTD